MGQWESGAGEKNLVYSDDRGFHLLRKNIPHRPRTHGALLLPLGGRKVTLQLEPQLVGDETRINFFNTREMKELQNGIKPLKV